MKNHRPLISAAISSLLALGITTSINSAFAADQEKCFGVAKAGHNGCNSNVNQHSCAGHSVIDNDPNDFTTVGKGTCVKVGGTLKQPSKAHKGS